MENRRTSIAREARGKYNGRGATRPPLALDQAPEAGETTAGNVNRNWAQEPSSESAEMVPPCRSMIVRVM